MATCKALVTHVTDDKADFKLEDIPIPTPSKNQALVRVESVAQNPTDYQAIITNAFGPNAVLGCDFVGTVTSLGPNTTRLSIGDRIAGLIWGGEIPRVGAYAEYTIADEAICFPVPKSVSSNDAVTVPLAAGTAWLALFSKTCLNISRTEKVKVSVLVWGGSSSVGQYTIQLARKYGLRVVTTCSPRHFDHCKELGAEHCFDYKEGDEVVGKIKEVVPGLAHVFDCVGAGESSTLASRCVGQEGGVLCTVRPGKANTEGVEKRVRVTDVLVWTAFLKDHKYKSFSWPASKEDHDLAAELYEKLPKWIEEGSLVPNRSKVLPGGLNAVREGFEMHKEGKISGFKLVYNP